MTESSNNLHETDVRSPDPGAVNPAVPITPAEQSDEAKKKRRRIVTVACVALVVIVVLLLLLTQCSGAQRVELAPEQDVSAQSLGQDEEKMQADEGGGAVNITYSGTARIDLAAKTVSMHLENPSRSTHDMAIELVIVSGGKETVVAESGLVPAGYELSTMDLSDSVQLAAGSYQGFYRISFFDPGNSEKAYMQSQVNLDSVTAS